MKKWIDRISDDAGRQCKRDPKCHRLDEHGGACKTFGVVLAEKLERAVRRVFVRVAGAS